MISTEHLLELPLGGSDCELCGYNWEEVSVTLSDTGNFYANERIGCYGGSIPEGDDLASLSAWLDEMSDKYPEHRDEIEEFKLLCHLN